MTDHFHSSAATEHAVWSKSNLVNLMTAVSKAHLDLTEQELFGRIADTMIKHLTAPAQTAPDNYSFGTDYGKDLLTDINQAVHRGGTNALVQDCLKRCYREITRLRAAADCARVGKLIDAVEAAQPPAAPVMQDSIAAIISGIGAADTPAEQALEIVPKLGRAGYAIVKYGDVPAAPGETLYRRVELGDGHVSYEAVQRSSAAPVETTEDLVLSSIETCRECGVRDPCGEDCPNYVEPKAHSRSSAATEVAVDELAEFLCDEYEGEIGSFCNFNIRIKDKWRDLVRAMLARVPAQPQPVIPSSDLAARAAELLTVPMGWGSGPALNALAEKIGGRISDVAARNQTFREALEAVVRMGREPQPLSMEETRQKAEDAIRTFCHSLSGAAVQMSHGEERIYYAGISLKALSAAVTMAVTRPHDRTGEA